MKQVAEGDWAPDFAAAAHVRFKSKYELNFPLLADEDHSVAESYGVWKQKSMYGRTFWGVERSTFAIDEGGGSRESGGEFDLAAMPRRWPRRFLRLVLERPAPRGLEGVTRALRERRWK